MHRTFYFLICWWTYYSWIEYRITVW